MRERKSIFVSFAVVAIALLTMVGCSYQAKYPAYFESGKIVQEVDFLTGQNFLPTNFKVYGIDMNGSQYELANTIILVDESSSATGKVDLGDTVRARIGENQVGEIVFAKAGIDIYDIQALTITGPAEIKNTDLAGLNALKSQFTVVASYYDKTGAEKTMTLSQEEYDFVATGPDDKYGITYEGGLEPTSSAVPASVTIKSNVGGEAQAVYEFSCLPDQNPAFTADKITKIVSVTVKEGAYLPALEYAELPAPSEDDVTVKVCYEGYTEAATSRAISDAKETDLVSFEGVELSYVNKYGEEIAVEDLASATGVGIKVTVNGHSKTSYDADGSPATVTVVKGENLTLSAELTEAGKTALKLAAGATLPAIDDSWVTVNLTATVNEESRVIARNLTAEDGVELGYADVDGNAVAAGTVAKADATYYVRAEYLGAKSGNEGEVNGFTIGKEISKITISSSGASIPKYDYGTVAPTVDDIDFNVVITYSDKSTETIPADTEGLTYAFVDADGFALQDYDFTTAPAANTVFLTVEYAGKTATRALAEADFTTVTLAVADNPNVEDKTYYKGEDLSAPDFNDFRISITVGSDKTFFENADDLTLYYTTEDDGTAPETPVTVVPSEEDTKLYVGVEYRGVIAASSALTVDEREPKVDGLAIEFADGYVGPAAQYYDEGKLTTALANPTEASKVLKSLTVSYDYGEDDEITETFTGVTLAYGFMVGDEFVKATAEDSPYDGTEVLADLYLQVTYKEFSEEFPVELGAPGKVETVEVTPSVAAGLIGDEITWAVNTRNTNGYVAKDIEDYDVFQNGAPVTELPAEFTATVQSNYKVSVTLTDADGSAYVVETSDDVSISVAAGTSYWNVTTPAIEPSDEFIALVDKSLSADIFTEGFDAYTLNFDEDDAVGTPAEPTVTFVYTTGQVVVEGENTVTANIEYVDATGEKVIKQAKFTFSGTSYTEESSIKLVYDDETATEIASNTMYLLKEYDLTKFGYDTESIEEHGDDAALELKGYCLDTYDPETTELEPMTGTITPNHASKINFVFGYTNATGAETEKVFTLNLTTKA